MSNSFIMSINKVTGISEITIEGKKIGNYVMTKTLGQGQFGKVFKAKNLLTGEELAIKKIDKSKIKSNPILERLLQTEVAIMHDIDHPNILHLYEFLESSGNYYLVLDFCSQGDFEHYLKNRGVKFLDEPEAVKFLKQIANGFQELRKRKILHRDFKLANLFVKDDNIVIGDFGFAKSGSEMAETKLGTPLTMAYEILCPESENSMYNSKADLWSVGVVYYQLLFGETPFFGFTMPDLIKDIKKKANGNLKYTKPISAESKDLLDRILRTNPKERMDWNQFFNHPLFDKYKPEPQQDLKHVFEALGKVMVSKHQQAENEFNNHKYGQQGDKNFQFMDQDNLLKYGEKNFMPAKNIQEVSLDSLAKDQIQRELTLKEITFRYNHEKNKILFIVYTVKKIQKSLKDGFLVPLTADMYNLSLVLLKKAAVLNECNIIHLQNRTNVYNLNQNYFNHFLSSMDYQQVLQIFLSDRDKLSGYMQMINKRSNENSIYTPYTSVLSVPMPNLLALDGILNDIYKSMLKYQNSPEANDSTRKRVLLLILASTKLSIESESRFPYMKDLNAKDKFNWTNFYDSHENSSIYELSNIIYN